jgi:cyclophilin family peptidyl-prolyl cis-trans isomerase
MKNYFVFLLALLIFSGCDKPAPTPKPNQAGTILIQNLKTDSNGLSLSFATIKTVHGDIIFRFYTKTAPVTSARIIQLIQQKFYDGLIIHRMIPNFIIQTGDPSGTGTGGSGEKLKPEFSSLQHIKGTIGLAHGFDVSSGDSQFYICLTTLPHLDSKYTVFGQVVEGFDVLSKLSKGDRVLSVSVDIKE